MPTPSRCAFLTTDRLDGFVVDDELAHEPLRRHGWRVETVPWRRAGVDWGRFDLVLIRTPWDYQHDPAAFLAVLEVIQASSARLENALELVRWNLEKTYLRDLAARGVLVPPTVWAVGLETRDLEGYFDELGADEIVIKPVVGANADHAYRLRRGVPEAAVRKLAGTFRRRPYLVQPFLPAVVEEGEHSLIYFGGALSHAILKRPKAEDFRSQEEHGSTITTVTAERALLERGRQALAALPTAPLYARADFVRHGGDDFALMELEVIEPALYFRMDPGAPERFARAVDAWMAGR